MKVYEERLKPAPEHSNGRKCLKVYANSFWRHYLQEIEQIIKGMNDYRNHFLLLKAKEEKKEKRTRITHTCWIRIGGIVCHGTVYTQRRNHLIKL